MKVLIQATGGTVECWLGHKMYTFPDREPIEVQSDFIAEHLLAQFWDKGLVEVAIHRIQSASGHMSGWEYNTDDAIKAAGAALLASEDRLVNQYVKAQYEDRLKKNLPPTPPNQMIQAIIDRRGINLDDYGIHPVGVKPSSLAADRNKALEEATALNARLSADMGRLLARLSQLESAGIIPSETGVADADDDPEMDLQDAEQMVSDGNGGRKPKKGKG